MISRVAEHCFWLSRYLERAENTARVLEVNQTVLLDLEAPIDHQWRPLLIISGVHDMPGEPDGERVEYYLTWEAANLGSVVSSLAAARENARIIREVISADMCPERMNYYHLWLQGQSARGLYDSNRSEFYNQIKRINQLLHGIAEGTMAHGEAWEFFRLGKYLERACQTARILDVKYHILLPTPQQVGTPVDQAHWVAILAQLLRLRAVPQAANRHDRPQRVGGGFPHLRSVVPAPRCADRLRECQAAARAISGRPGDAAEQAVQDLADWLEAKGIDGLLREGLHESLTHVVNSIHGVGEAVDRAYFDVGPQTPPAPAAAPPKEPCQCAAAV